MLLDIILDKKIKRGRLTVGTLLMLCLTLITRVSTKTICLCVSVIWWFIPRVDMYHFVLLFVTLTFMWYYQYLYKIGCCVHKTMIYIYYIVTQW